MTRPWRATLFFLLCASVTACGAGGVGAVGGASAQPTATPQPTAAPAEAVEQAAGIATSTVVALAAFVAQGAVSGTHTSAPAQPAAVWRRLRTYTSALTYAADTADNAVSATAGSCAHGGTVDASCSESGNGSTVTLALSGCGIVDSTTGDVIVASGNLVVTVAARGVCASGDLPQQVMLSFQTTDFLGTVSDSSGTVIERFSANLTETFTPAGQGCAGDNGTELFDGARADQADAGALDVALSAHALSLAVTSSGSPCARRLIASGALDVQDHVSHARFSGAFHATQASLIDQGNGNTVATLDGSLTDDCLGEVDVRTATPLQFLRGSECAVDGRLLIRRADGTDARIEFGNAGSVAFDFNADGTADMTVPTCTEALQCTR